MAKESASPTEPSVSTSKTSAAGVPASTTKTPSPGSDKVARTGRAHNSDSHPDSPWARKIILSLDGGGIRGYASLHILEEIMRRVTELERGDGHAPVESSADYPWFQEVETISELKRKTFVPHHYIDYFVGTSTGGLSAIMLGRLQMTVWEAKKNYDEVGNHVFSKPRRGTAGGLLAPRYKARYFERVLQRATQRDVLSRHLSHSGQNDSPFTRDSYQTRIRADKVHLRNDREGSARTIVVAHGGTQAHRSVVFRSYSHPMPTKDASNHLNPGPGSDFPLWKVGRATGAAPSYFSPLLDGNAKYEDGAIGRKNNPSELAYTEVTQMHWRHRPLMIISIGTGKKPSGSIKTDKWYRKILPNVHNLNDVRKNFKRLVLDSQEQHQRFRETIEKANENLPEQEKIQYFRFNVPDYLELTKVKLDDWKGPKGVTTKTDMERAVNSYIHGQHNGPSRDADEKDVAFDQSIDQNLRKCARTLVELRRERASTERWEEFALHVTYCCNREGCKAPPFENRFKLRRHAARAHGLVTQVRLCQDGNPTNVIAAWSCCWDHCGEQQISGFETASDLEAHLKALHKIQSPKAYTNPAEFEAWLDECREAQRPAISPQSTNASHQPNGGLS